MYAVECLLEIDKVHLRLYITLICDYHTGLLVKTLTLIEWLFFLTDDLHGAYVPGAERDSQEEESQGLTFHGIILRSQLVTLLKKRVFYSESNQVNTCTFTNCTSCINNVHT